MVDFITRLGLMESAKQGWLNKLEEAEAFLQQRYAGVHTKMNTSDLDTDFSVQDNTAFDPPPPDIGPTPLANGGNATSESDIHTAFDALSIESDDEFKALLSIVANVHQKALIEAN